MQPLARRRVLQLMLGVGAAAATGLTVANPADAKDLSAVPEGAALPVEPAQAAGEAVDSALETNQFIIVRRRRWRRRRVYYVRPRRRRVVYFVRRRPRRYYRVVRVRRFRRRRW